MTRSFLFDGLDADGPASDRADKMGLYGWLVGTWSMEAQIHRAGGIVQEGQNEDGSRLRWSFSDITPHSFLWLGERSKDDGRTWMRRVEIAAKRTAGPL